MYAIHRLLVWLAAPSEVNKCLHVRLTPAFFYEFRHVRLTPVVIFMLYG